MVDTVESLRQHQLVILRRLRHGPLTEFELAKEISSSSGRTVEQATDSIPEWLDELRSEGLIWAGSLTNSSGQRLMAAALTKKGRELLV